MLPETAIAWHRGEHALRQLAVTLLFLGVPTVLLLGAALVAPRQLLTIVFGARLATAAPAFATLVGAMACLGVTVVLTNYLFGAARRWIVALLGAGVVVLVVLIHLAQGAMVATARAELEVQGGLALVVTAAFAATHLRFHPSRRSVPPIAGVDSVSPH
jgi:O-antigen/teichoic acid export membrane protein